MNKWGFLRENTKNAIKAGIDKETGLHRTGLEEYLKVIFPDINDWIHDMPLGKIDGVNNKIRPDYRSELLKLVVEFDGVHHYQKPHIIENDTAKTKRYEEYGYKVVRIPYFIQLTNTAVKTLFNVIVEEPLFDVNIPSLSPSSYNTPAYLCPIGIERMIREFKQFPDQLEVNYRHLIKFNSEFTTGISYLKT
jgi:hypothetical protein